MAIFCKKENIFFKSDEVKTKGNEAFGGRMHNPLAIGNHPRQK